jgi:hypothetical protein
MSEDGAALRRYHAAVCSPRATHPFAASRKSTLARATVEKKDFILKDCRTVFVLV